VVTKFVEKPESGEQVTNGGFFVLSPRILEYIEGDETVWEHEPLRNLAKDSELTTYQHPGFWQSMDTIHERRLLEELYATGSPPWLSESCT
jgi:glucose-1-phosphate cytidylyltransferase